MVECNAAAAMLTLVDGLGLAFLVLALALIVLAAVLIVLLVLPTDTPLATPVLEVGAGMGDDDVPDVTFGCFTVVVAPGAGTAGIGCKGVGGGKRMCGV